MSEELLGKLILAVKNHYEHQREPLLLSRLGQLKGLPRNDLVEMFGGLAKAVKAAGADLVILNPHNKPGNEVVATTAIADEIENTIKYENASAEAVDIALEGLPASLLIAFCVRADQSQKVIIQTKPPFRYSLIAVASPVPDSNVLIEEEFRIAGLHWANASGNEKRRVWTKILAWAEHHNIAPEIFTAKKKDTNSTQAASQGGTNALARFLGAQDIGVVDKILIPADIVKLLMSHK